MQFGQLSRMASPDITVGVGLRAGDPRRGELESRATFCPVSVYRDPESLLGDLREGEIGAAVRGSLPAAAFLSRLKDFSRRKSVRRVALLLLPDGRAFLLAPVGIDEGGTQRSMLTLAGDCRTMCGLLGWEPRVAVLSAGRPEDAGRGRWIEASLKRGERLEEMGEARHYHIGIEEALGWANCVIAPDGLSGNLIYRTLTRLGSGSSLGALYFPLSLRCADTSRTGTVEEYLGAVALANIAARVMGSG